MELARLPAGHDRPPLVVHNHAYPGGVAYYAPDVDHLYWRTVGGIRTDFQSVVAGADDATRGWLGEAHAEAVHRITLAAMRRLAQGGGGARPLLGAAGRLVHEPLNGYPAWSTTHD